jgi:hypothetical protein
MQIMAETLNLSSRQTRSDVNASKSIGPRHAGPSCIAALIEEPEWRDEAELLDCVRKVACNTALLHDLVRPSRLGDDVAPYIKDNFTTQLEKLIRLAVWEAYQASRSLDWTAALVTKREVEQFGADYIEALRQIAFSELSAIVAPHSTSITTVGLRDMKEVGLQVARNIERQSRDKLVRQRSGNEN